MSRAKPSIEELRAVAQPHALVTRRSAEHWAGRWYMRRLSLHVTRQLVATPVTPNALTLAMIAVGLLAAAVATVPGVLTALCTAALIQAYLLLDCVDGEVARWRRTTSAAGVYLDRLGHHVVEAALVVGLGVRAAGGPTTRPSWWVTVGAFSAVLVLLGKVETDLVVVARAGAGLSARDDAEPESRIRGVRRLRRSLSRLPLHRVVGAIELSLLLVVAAVVDGVAGEPVGTRVLLGGTAVVAAVVAVGHPVTILTSGRLR